MIREIDDVRCITIVHPLHEIRKYREYSAFFRLIGIFVCEKKGEADCEDLTDYMIAFSDGVDTDPFVNSLSVFDSMVTACVISTNMEQLFQKIYKVFHDKKLMRASYAIAYFFDAKKKEIYDQMYRSYDCFKEALEEFEKLERSCNVPGELKYIWAAKSNCRRRMNELYTDIWTAIKKGFYGSSKEEKAEYKRRLWKRKIFSFAEVNEDIQKILDYEPDYYGAYAIRGFAAELDENYRFDSVSDLLRAVKCIGRRSYASYVYYRIGKYCESIRGDLSEKWEYYRLSWELDSKNYRALYKLMLKEKVEGNLEKAEAMCRQLQDILSNLENSPALQPIECAYLVKTYTIWGDVCIRQEKFNEGINYLKKAEQIYKNETNEDLQSGFYPWMFVDESKSSDEKELQIWKVYKKAAREKLKIKAIYKRIANVASDIGNRELYDKYYPLSLN